MYTLTFLMWSFLLPALAGVCWGMHRKLKLQGMQIAELKKGEQQYLKFMEKNPNKIVRFDADCRRIYINHSEGYYHDIPASYLLGKTVAECPGGPSAIVFEQAIHEVFNTKGSRVATLQGVTNTGRMQMMRFELMPELNSQGDVVSVLGLGQDITEIVESKHHLQNMVNFDPLTQLPNRTYITQLFQELVTHPSPKQHVFCLICLHMDNLNEFYGLLGNLHADELICDVAKRLQNLLPPAATLAKISGNQFAILIPQLQIRARAAKLAETIFKTFSNPFHIAQKDIFITCNIGIVFSPQDSNTVDQLLIYANTAIYHAKKQGRNNFQFYQPDFTVESIARTELEIALHKAVTDKQLELYYQPQVSLGYATSREPQMSSGDPQILGAEALLRWNHPVHGMLSPDKFIPLAEETGLIVEIGEWVLLTAFRLAMRLNQHAETPFQIAINLSSRQFFRNDLVASIIYLLRKTQCRPQWVKLEITESLLLDEYGNVHRILTELTEMGFQISIDDFGTGYSALGYLTRYPIGQIKIDRSFISDIPLNVEKSELVKVLIQIAKVLHLDLVAEGVETHEQVDYLVNAGCRVAQGYFYFKPMPQKEFQQLMKKTMYSIEKQDSASAA